MATPLSEKAKPKAARLTLPHKGLANWVTLRAVFKRLIEATGLQIQIDGASEVEAFDGGIRFKVKPGGDGSGLHPFYCHPIVDDEVQVEMGQVQGVNASGYTLTGFSGSGTEIVYLAVTGSLGYTSEGFVLTGGVVSSCSLNWGGTVPSNGGGVYYREVARYVDGVKVGQAVVTSLEVVWFDDGTGSSTPRIVWGSA